LIGDNMTGQIVQLDRRGWGEIRSSGLPWRIRFDSGALVDIPLAEALGLEVEFDVLSIEGRTRAVHVRRTATEPAGVT